MQCEYLHNIPVLSVTSVDASCDRSRETKQNWDKILNRTIKHGRNFGVYLLWTSISRIYLQLHCSYGLTDTTVWLLYQKISSLPANICLNTVCFMSEKMNRSGYGILFLTSSTTSNTLGKAFMGMRMGTEAGDTKRKQCVRGGGTATQWVRKWKSRRKVGSILPSMCLLAQIFLISLTGNRAGHWGFWRICLSFW